ncbi:bifunctional ADP-dependent NAD(P)H-hydrate dehydratase/NAD(P)H-hydrate epimerase [soil metagenome]
MERIDPALRRRPLHGVTASREIERLASMELPLLALVTRAADALARLSLAIAPNAAHIWIAAGPGNNGADGLLAAVNLARWGKRVTVTAPMNAQRRSAESVAAWTQAQEAGIAITTQPPALEAADLAIDALLGLGANRPPEDAIAQAVGTLNTQRCSVLAADLPSGLNADSGMTSGGDCVRATHTLSLLTLHPGLFTGRGRDQAGEVWFDDLRVGQHVVPDAWLNAGEDTTSGRNTASHSSHKGSFGDVAVVGGSSGMTGAALLAARAAHAAGAGRVFVSVLDAGSMSIDAGRPELMFRHEWWASDVQTLSLATVVCGCGGGADIVDALPALLRSSGRLVLDADALNAIARERGLASLLRGRAANGLTTVLTPHPLEAARLLGIDTHAVQADRVFAAKALASRYGCVAVLKGSGTVIASPRAIPVINSTGNSSLGTAGTGDVLAGWISGLWARAAGGEAKDAKTPADLCAMAMSVAAAAVHAHGQAADRAGRVTLRAADLIEMLATRQA